MDIPASVLKMSTIGSVEGTNILVPYMNTDHLVCVLLFRKKVHTIERFVWELCQSDSVAIDGDFWRTGLGGHSNVTIKKQSGLSMVLYWFVILSLEIYNISDNVLLVNCVINF